MPGTPLEVLWYRPALLFLPHKAFWEKGAAATGKGGGMGWV